MAKRNDRSYHFAQMSSFKWVSLKWVSLKWGRIFWSCYRHGNGQGDLGENAEVKEVRVGRASNHSLADVSRRQSLNSVTGISRTRTHSALIWYAAQSTKGNRTLPTVAEVHLRHTAYANMICILQRSTAVWTCARFKLPVWNSLERRHKWGRMQLNNCRMTKLMFLLLPSRPVAVGSARSFEKYSSTGCVDQTAVISDKETTKVWSQNSHHCANFILQLLSNAVDAIEHGSSTVTRHCGMIRERKFVVSGDLLIHFD